MDPLLGECVPKKACFIIFVSEYQISRIDSRFSLESTFLTWQKWGFCVFAYLWMFLVGGEEVHRYANIQILQMIFNHICSPAQFKLINWYTDILILEFCLHLLKRCKQNSNISVCDGRVGKNLRLCEGAWHARWSLSAFGRVDRTFDRVGSWQDLPLLVLGASEGGPTGGELCQGGQIWSATNHPSWSSNKPSKWLSHESTTAGQRWCPRWVHRPRTNPILSRTS